MYLLVKFFLHCDFKHFAFDVSQILVRLKKTGFRIKKTGFRIKKQRRLPLGRITIQKGTTKTGLLEKEQKGISLYLNK